MKDGRILVCVLKLAAERTAAHERHVAGALRLLSTSAKFAESPRAVAAEPVLRAARIIAVRSVGTSRPSSRRDAAMRSTNEAGAACGNPPLRRPRRPSRPRRLARPAQDRGGEDFRRLRGGAAGRERRRVRRPHGRTTRPDVVELFRVRRFTVQPSATARARSGVSPSRGVSSPTVDGVRPRVGAVNAAVRASRFASVTVVPRESA